MPCTTQHQLTSSIEMGLLDLPADILREILVLAVTVRSLKRGLRLRHVNRRKP
jgi:hypothetical protein